MSRHFWYNIKILTLAQQLDNAINECYNDKISEKTIM